MISVEKVHLNFGGFDLFKGISFLITPKDRIGLIGRNGAGKTTLLKMLNGKDQPSSGQITVPKDLTIGYLPQHMVVSDTLNLKGEVTLAFEELLAIEKEIKHINHQLENRTDYESESYLKLIDKLTESNERYQILGGENYEAEIEQTLIGLGFKRSDFNRPTSEFSGGWRMRVELAKIILKKPSVFLLDEPTNHLDIESIQWLEDFLKNYKGAVVMVSHDKAFLDNVTTRTIEISLGKIYDQKTNYSGFIKWKQETREQQLAAYNNQQKMIAETEQFIERFRAKATKAVQVQSRIKQLNKLERLEIEEEDTSAMRIKFPPAPRSGSIIVEGKSISKNYGSLSVLKDIDILIEKGERIAFVGKNGEGKTTLAKIILEEIQHEGYFKLGHNVKIGYFAQNQPQLLDDDKTVFETIDHIAVGEIRTKIRNILGSFLFSGEDVDKKVKVLSGGERSRLAMIKLLLEPVNFLILDEPTNHLDINSKEILKNALLEFDGTILVVSHDREFLDGLVNCVYEFKNKKIKQHLGGIYDFLLKKKIESLNQLGAQLNKSTSTPKAQEPKSITFEERKEISRNISRLSKGIDALEEQIADLEEKIKEHENLLANPEKVEVETLYTAYDSLKKDLDTVMQEWETTHEELENWNEKKTWQ